MKNLIVFFFLLVSCGSLATDGTPPWDLAGRFAIPMSVDCNIAKKNLGLSGCSFRQNQLGGNLTLPSLWSGDITFTSYNCKNLTVTANSSNDNVIQIRDLYTAPNNYSCSFQITRTIKEKDFVADNTMIGRFFIKIIPNDPFYSKLKFSLLDNEFDGVGWFQSKGQPINLTIKTMSDKGVLYVTCGNREVLRQNYSSTKFDISLPIQKCDYEINAVNYESGIKELATFMLEIPKVTLDVTPPVVSSKSGKITFTFNEKDSSNKKPVVMGVIIDKTKCIKTNSCSVKYNKQFFTVMGMTPSLRLFYGVYNDYSKKWEVF